MRCCTASSASSRQPSSSSWDFWPTVLLAVFAAIGVVIGKYRDGDRKTRQQMKQVLERFN